MKINESKAPARSIAGNWGIFRGQTTRNISRHFISLYYSTIAPFYHIKAKERAKYATLLHCRKGQKYGLKRSYKMAAQNEPTLEKYKWRNFGIINPLFDGLTYNTSGHFAHCSYFSSPLRASENTTQLAKYPRVLYVRPSNKVYVFFIFTCMYIENIR